MTVVDRLHAGGIRRTGSPKAGFRYRAATGGRVGPRLRARIALLRVPPAWTAVAIARSSTAWIQAVGQDRAGRWQYLYHPRAVARRERRKHHRLVAFVRQLPSLRGRVRRDLATRDLGRDRVLACVLRILSICFLRPGSEEYANENGSFGIAKLRPRHVAVRGARVRLRFRGKSGKAHRHEFTDQRTASTLRALLKAGGRRVFTFEEGDGTWRAVRRAHINGYIKEAMGEAFSAKDFRTWAGSITCACALARLGADPSDSPRDVKRKVTAAIAETSEALGNTPAVSRTSYVSPAVLRAFEDGRVIHPVVDSVRRLATYPGRLHRCERSLLRLLQQYGPARGRRRKPAAHA